MKYIKWAGAVLLLQVENISLFYKTKENKKSHYCKYI